MDEDALHAAVADIMTRHAILRSAFDLTNYSEPLQLVYDSVDVPLQFHDFSEMDELTREKSLQNGSKQKRTSFCMARGSAISNACTSPWCESFHFTLSFHHAILDGWSTLRC